MLIEHPHEGLILWETGSGKDYPTVWGPQLSDVFTRVRYEAKHELDAQIEATGHKVEDVKKIIIGHLHLDHAGGLDLFLDRKDVEIWVHDLELRSAFWSVATGADVGVYLQHYLKLGLNWKTFDERSFDFWRRSRSRMLASAALALSATSPDGSILRRTAAISDPNAAMASTSRLSTGYGSVADAMTRRVASIDSR